MCRLVLISLLALLPASAAQAATVGTTAPFCPKGCFELGSLVYTAAPGEANQVTLRARLRGGLLVRDPGAEITPGAGCEPVDVHAVRCVVQDPTVPYLKLGDGDDRALLLAAGKVDGGDGADVLRSAPGLGDVGLEGGPGDDALTLGDRSYLGRLDGGDGDDQLAAGRGMDVLVGGAGDDTLAAGRGADVLEPGAGADTVDGGPGADTLSHGDRLEPLIVDLAAATSAEDSMLRAIEHVWGGQGADRISGTVGSDRLHGGGGDDELRGQGGDDELTGDAGADLVDGGDGDDIVDGAGDLDDYDQTLRDTDENDVLLGGPGEDALDGGPGDDRVECGGGDDLSQTGVGVDVHPAPAGALRTDCERIYVDAGSESFCLRAASARLLAGALVFGNPCRHLGFPRRAVKVSDEAGAVLAAGDVRARHARVRLKLTAGGRAALQPNVPFTARFSIGASGDGPGRVSAIALAPRG